ncbi:MAG: ABC transporter substrate-binding protein [Bacilli bacterium]
MKKRFGVILFLVLALAGCSSSTGTDSDKTVIEWSVWDSEFESTYNALAEAFEAQNPDIDVEVQYVSYDDFFTKLDTATLGSETPDVVLMQTRKLGIYAESGLLMPLTDVLDAGELAKYNTESVERFSIDDELYAIPRDITTRGLYYNASILEEAGLDGETYPKDWDQLVEMSREISSKTDKYAFCTDPGDETYVTFAYQNGAKLVDENGQAAFDSPKAITAYEFMNTFASEGLMPLPEENPSCDDLFISGQVAFYPIDMGKANFFVQSDYADDYRIAPLPSPSADNPGGLLNGNAIAALASTDTPEETELFMNFLLSDEANELWAKCGLIPAKDGFSDGYVEKYPFGYMDKVVDGLVTAQPLPALMDNSWQQKGQEILNAMWSGDITPEEAVTQTNEAINESVEME